MWYLIYVYLRLALFCGFQHYAYRLTKRWSSSIDHSCRARAAEKVRRDVLKRGYARSPSVYWEVLAENNRVKDDHDQSSQEDVEEEILELMPEDRWSDEWTREASDVEKNFGPAGLFSTDSLQFDRDQIRAEQGDDDL